VRLLAPAASREEQELAFAIAFRHRCLVPKIKIKVVEWRDPNCPEWAPLLIVVVRGLARTARLVEAPWKEVRRLGRQHYAHEIASALVRRVLEGDGSLRVGDKTLELKGMKGSGFFGIVMGARLVGDAEDVAFKVFLGRDPQAAFEYELKNLQTVTTRISLAALVVRLVGWVEAGVAGPTATVAGARDDAAVRGEPGAAHRPLRPTSLHAAGGAGVGGAGGAEPALPVPGVAAAARGQAYTLRWRFKLRSGLEA
jgi:hypothetical protein